MGGGGGGGALTFLLEDDGDHVRVVVGDGHVQGALQGQGRGVLSLRLQGLQVGVGPLLEQLRRQAGQTTQTGRVQGGLALMGTKETERGEMD